MRRLIPCLILLFVAPLALAQNGALAGFCTQGAVSAQTQGLQSTNKLQGIIPSCLVTVYLAGTQTPATLFKQDGSSLTNPFTASANGQWLAYAANGQEYDVVGSGGVAPNSYPAPVVLITAGSVSNGGAFLPLGGGTLYGALIAPEINGEIYPASCQSSSPASWCPSGGSASAKIIAACNQLPAGGGIINQIGLTGNLDASLAGCMSPTKQVIFLTDPTHPLLITETDGLITYPLDNNSMLLGPGAGQCRINNNTTPIGGMHLDPSANVAAIVGPAHTDGTQEDFTVTGVCLWGKSGATVSQGLIYDEKTYVNTTISDNNVAECPNACILIRNPGGMISVVNNEANVTDGDYTIVGSPLVIDSSGTPGCQAQSITLDRNNLEHANGGANYPELNIVSSAGAQQGCAIYVNNTYVERNTAGTPSTIGINIQDCFSCSVTNAHTGGSAGGADFIHISQTAQGRIQNIILQNVDNLYGAWTNTINDTTPGAPPPITFAAYPYVATYFSNPGYQQIPALPASTLQSVSADILLGIGNFNTGTSTLGTGFQVSGCLSSAGVVCTFTRTNSTAPPGYTYSQEMQVTTNTDPGGSNGIRTTATFAYTAGVTYQIPAWVKSDGTFNGIPTAYIGNPITPTTICFQESKTAVTTTWQPITFYCTPNSTGSSYFSLLATTPTGGGGSATGTIYFAGFSVTPVSPMQPGEFLGPVGPYSIGGTSPIPTMTQTCAAGLNGNSYMVADVTTFTSGAVYVAGGSNTAPIVCSFNGSAYAWKVF